MTFAAALSINSSSSCSGRETSFQRHAGLQRGIQRRCFGVRQTAASTRRQQVTMMPIGVPKVPVRTPKESMWQWTDLWNCLYRERIIFIGKKIDEEMGNQLVAIMLYLDSENTKPISLYINSPGGEVTPALAMRDTMTHMKSPAQTLAFGMAASMAGFILACGDKNRRMALPHTRIMLHQPYGAARGQASDIQNEAKELIRLRKYMWEVLAKQTGKSPEQVSKDLARDRYFLPEEAKDYGVIDRVIRPFGRKAEQN